MRLSVHRAKLRFVSFQTLIDARSGGRPPPASRPAGEETARAAERYTGAVEPIDAVAGHIAGAVNHPFTQNLGPGGRFLPASELRRRPPATIERVDFRSKSTRGTGCL